MTTTAGERILDGAATGDVAALDAALRTDPGVIRALDEDGWTPLHLAAYYRHVRAVEYLLLHGADPNAVSQNTSHATPLHAAVSEPKGGAAEAEILRALIAHGARVNAVQAGGFTPLHGAAGNGDEWAVQYLVAHGADAYAESDDGDTPFAIALKRGHPELAYSLREQGMRISGSGGTSSQQDGL